MKNWILKVKSAIAIPLVGFVLITQSIAQDDMESLATGPNMDDIFDEFVAREMEMEGVLEKLAELSGRSILRPQQLPTPKITFDSRGPISRGELLLAFESLLSLNGIGIAPLGDRFLKVVQLSNIPREAPELVTESLADRAPSGKVVSKLFRLQYLDSQAFQQQIQPFLSQNSVIPFQNSNAVIVTDTVSNLQRLEYVVSQVDKPSRLNIETVFYSLQYAQASEVAEQIQRMIDDARTRFGDSGKSGGQNTGNRGSGTSGAATTVAPAASAEGAVSVQVLFGSNTAISSDDRTNQLIIMTEPGNLGFFEEMIEKLDIQADPSTRIEVIPLKHADATEVASLLSQFVSGNSKSDGSDRSAADTNQGASRQPRNTFSDNNGPPEPRENSRASAQPTSTASGGDDRDSQFSSFMTIVSDERSNSLVISGTRSDLELMSALINDIDTLLPQVRIEVIIAEVSLTKGIDRGMDAFQIDYALNAATSTTPKSESLTSPGFNVLGIGLNSPDVTFQNGKYTLNSLSTVFNRARENSDVNILSSPTIVTMHNKEATIIAGEARPLITGTSQSQTLGNRSTVQYRDIGIELTVKPLIGPNDVIQLEIDQLIDDLGPDVIIDQNAQPTITRRQASSYVAVKSGEVVILGGLQKQQNNDSSAKVGILGEIPLVGHLFRSKRKTVVKTELLVFIRPHVVRTTDDVNQDARQKIETHQISEKIERFLDEGTVLSEPFDQFEKNTKDSDTEPAKAKGFKK